MLQGVRRSPARLAAAVFRLFLFQAAVGGRGCFKVSDEVLPVSQQLFSGFSYFKQLLVGGTQLSTDFWRALRNTFILSFYGLCFGFPIPIILALFFNEIRSNAARSVYQVLTYLPKFMSTVVMTSLVTMLVKQGSLTTGMGIVSQAMESLGLISHEVAKAGLLNNPAFFRSIYQISGIWEGAGYDSIVFFAAIIAISPTSYEAAQIDGADKWAQMRYVVLPSILSTIVIMLITRIGSLLNIGYEKVLLLYNTNTYVTADVVSTFANRQGMSAQGAGTGIDRNHLIRPFQFLLDRRKADTVVIYRQYSSFFHDFILPLSFIPVPSAPV